MDFIFSLLTVGGLFFWFFLAIVGFVLFANIHNEKPGWGLIVVLLALGALQLASDFKPFTWIAQNPWTFAMYVGGYLVVAVAWTVIKWFMFTTRAKETYAAIRADFVASLGRPFDVVNDKAGLHTKITYSNYNERFGRQIPPSPRENKRRIMLWLVFWPLDAIWSIINDPVVRLFRFIYTLISGTLQRISTGRFKGFEELN